MPEEGYASLHWGVIQAPASIPERIQRAVDFWQEFWHTGQPMRPMEGGSLGSITGEQIQAVIKRLPQHKAVGPDHWSPAELKPLPQRAHTQLAKLLQQIEAQGQWPQVLRNMYVALIPKPGAKA